MNREALVVHKAKDLVYADFNQDFSCIIVGTTRGFCIYNCEPLSKCYNQECGFAVGVCKMLHNSSLVAVAGAGETSKSSPRKLKIINTKRQSIVCEFNYPTAILNILLNRKRLIAVLDNRIHIYELGTMKIIQTLEVNAITGECALSSDSETSILAYASNTNEGIVEIFDCLSMRHVMTIHAHRNPICKLAISLNGALLATASRKGTIIRLFDLKTGERIGQFRRGTYPATITYLSFSHPDSSFLLAISDSITVHIFRLEEKIGAVQRNPTKSFLKNDVVGPLLSDRISDTLESSRDFSSLKLPYVSASAIGAIITGATSGSMTNKEALVRILTAESTYLIYSIDLAKGGEGKLINRIEIDLSSTRENNDELKATSPDTC